ncbi:nucleolar protein 4 [Sporothrix schenckii 1099-18]|uniref:Nucleolar protein 4 n=1 Tax=Sporothrix schenckii 1099-18 TaxID=1397361 RepID=A0A0F2MG26_SPOSC|nr:nucleolar protein 4 [Sporothrix schenckii 1099-18]KJR88653.1 nucleolar protein 4 [Sporothrix schenckii 1099-18]
MAKSVTQKRRREAEADQERRHEESGDAQSAAITAPPNKKARVEERRSIFVRSLPTTATSEKLTEFFSEHFPVKHATVVTDPKTKESRGYGFVTFTDAEDAAEAKAKLDNQLLEGRRLRLEIAEPRSRPTATNASAKAIAGAAAAADKKKKREEDMLEARKAPKLIVRNLPWSVKTSQDLAALFRMYGKVKFADLPSSKGKLSGFGFVTLRGKKNAENAIVGVNGKVVDGRTLAVDFAVDKQKWEELQQKDSGDNIDDAEETKDAKSPKTKTSKAGKEASGPPKTAEQLQAEEDMRNFMKDNMENLEEEEDDDDDAKDDDTTSDEEGSEDDEEKEWEDDDEEEDEDEVEAPKKVLTTDNSSTLFVRNLPFTTTDAELKSHFSKFGPLRYARIVMDRATDRPAGTGFVCFVSEEDAKACVRTAPRAQKPAVTGKHSVLQDERVDRDGRYTLNGRVLQVAQAVSKAEATKLFEEGPAAQRAREKDKRHLFLLSEGTIAVGSPLYNLLPAPEIKMREASVKQRQTMIKSNPSLSLSLTRLAIRNIPRHIDSKGLKELARKAVVGFATDVKEGRRQPLARDEIARGGQQDREAEQLRRAKGKGVVKQAKVVFETEKGTKVDESNEGGKSRGYGFIEYWSHRWALTALRWLNGHAVQNGNKTNRLIVEFAIENANVVARRKANEERSRNPRPPRPEGEANDETNGPSNGRPRGNSKFGKFDKSGKSQKPSEKPGKFSRAENFNKSTKNKKGASEQGGEKTLAQASKAAKAAAKTGKGDTGADGVRPSKKERADAKLAVRQQIIQRKRMMRKKKGASRG